MIRFFSNLPEGLRSGGFSAMNAAAYTALASAWPVTYTGPINPPVRTAAKIAASLLRRIGVPRDFSFFSEDRLRRIATEYTGLGRVDAALDFFHGFTPWILTRPDRPYLAWSDCTFHDYVRIYHDVEGFKASDLARIEEAEATWLSGAERILFTSRWAANRALETYGLRKDMLGVVGLFGEADLPENDAYEDGSHFLFVSTNFVAKGGPTVIEAFRKVRRRYPEARLTVVGDRPNGGAVEAGVTYAGYLRKEDPGESKRFRELVGSVRSVVHPTKSDILPLILIECGYHGCPVIASRRFAIPELVSDAVNGFLLNDPSDAGALEEKMIRMITMDDYDYRRMRAASWERTRGFFSKVQFESRLCSEVEGILKTQG